MMIHRVSTLVAALTVLPLFCNSPVTAAQRRNADREAAAAAQSIAPSAATKQESDAFTLVRNTDDTAARLAAADKFLSAYPTTQLVGIVNLIRMDAFLELRQYKEAIAAGRQGLADEARYMDGILKRTEPPTAATVGRRNTGPVPVDKNSAVFKSLVSAMDNDSLYFYRQMVTAAQQLDDASTVLDLSDKALALSPDELFFLIASSGVLAGRPPDDEKERDAAMKRAEEMGRKAAEQVITLVSGPSGAGMPAEQKAGLLNTVHSTLGRVYLNEKKYDESQKSYMAAIAAKKDDAFGYYMLGVAYTRQSPPKLGPAMEAFARSVYLKGPMEGSARPALEVVYQQQKKSLDGIDQYIQSQGSQVGK